MGKPYSKLDLELIKSKIDVAGLLSSYGGKLFSGVNSGNTIRSSCVVHGGSNPTSLSYGTDSAMFKCFGSCGFKGDVFALIQEVEGCSFVQAVNKAAQLAGVTSNGYEPKSIFKADPWISTLESVYGKKSEKNKVIYSPLVNSALKFKPNPYVSAGKFTQETIDYFEVGYCNFNDAFMDRAIITIHDEDGNLIGFSGRDMKNSVPSSTNKYRIKKGFKKGCSLYNLHRARKNLSRSNPLVIVEGFGQTWRLWEAGIDTAVALMGKDLTPEQYELVLENATSVVLALDFDGPGVEATKVLVDRLDGLVDVSVVTTKYSPEIDLGDMSVDMARECYDNRVPAYLWVSEIYPTRLGNPDS